MFLSHITFLGNYCQMHIFNLEILKWLKEKLF